MGEGLHKMFLYVFRKFQVVLYKIEASRSTLSLSRSLDGGRTVVDAGKNSQIGSKVGRGAGGWEFPPFLTFPSSNGAGTSGYEPRTPSPRSLRDIVQISLPVSESKEELSPL